MGHPRTFLSRGAAALLAALAAPAVAGTADGWTAYSRGAFAEAEAAATARLRDNQDDTDARVLLGRAQLGEHKAAEAVDTLKDATRRAPGSAEAHFALGEALTIRVNEVNFFRQSMMARDIHKEFERAVELEPATVRYREALFDFYRQAPALVGGGMDKARAEAATLAKLDEAAGHRAAGALAVSDGKAAQAEAEYRAAMRADPRNPDAYFALGELHQQNHHYDEAFSDFTALLKHVPTYGPANYEIGKTAALSGKRLELGESALRHYLDYVPKPDEPPLSWAHARLGGVYEKMERIGDARREFEAALQMDSKLEEARRGLASLPK